MRSPSLIHFSQITIRIKIKHFAYLQGINKQQIVKILSRNFNWLTCSVHWMEQHLKFLSYISPFQPQRETFIFRHPQILSYSVKTMLERIRSLQIEGFENSQVTQITERMTQIVSISTQHNLGPTVFYLKREIGFQNEKIASNPVLLSLSLKNRIIPRHKTVINLSHRPIISRLIINKTNFYRFEQERRYLSRK